MSHSLDLALEAHMNSGEDARVLVEEMDAPEVADLAEMQRLIGLAHAANACGDTRAVYAYLLRLELLLERRQDADVIENTIHAQQLQSHRRASAVLDAAMAKKSAPLVVA